jgi:PiT family inorganic phosphate transporter
VIEALLFALTLFLAYSNGANDNFKGVATLYGSGATSYKDALALATGAQLAGSLCALLLAGGLLASFSGKGLVENSIVNTADFRIATVAAVGATVILATRLGFPISTTMRSWGRSSAVVSRRRAPCM